SPKEIRHLYMRFRKLDRGRQGAVTAEDLGMIPELSTNPLGPRIVELLDEEHSGHIMFHQFLQRMSVFSGHAGREAKVAFMFRVWDVNGDGYITSEDLHETLKSMVGRKLPQATLDELVQRTLAAADLDGDGKITQHEFGLAMANFALGTTLQVPMVSSEDDTHTVTATPPPTPKPESGYVPADVSVAAKGAGPKLDLPSIPVAATAQGTPQVVPGRKA
ncbi:CNB1, partial [Symbiodinium sp. KB8]